MTLETGLHYIVLCDLIQEILGRYLYLTLRHPHLRRSTTRGPPHSTRAPYALARNIGIQSRRPAPGQRQAKGATGEVARLVRAASSHLVLHTPTRQLPPRGPAGQRGWRPRRRHCRPAATPKRTPPPPHRGCRCCTCTPDEPARCGRGWTGRGAAPVRPAGTQRCAAAASAHDGASWPARPADKDAPCPRPRRAGGHVSAGLQRGGLAGDQSNAPLGGPQRSAR